MNKPPQSLREQCEAQLEAFLKSSDPVNRLIGEIEKLGCVLPQGFFACRPCGDDANISGGFLTNDIRVAHIDSGDNVIGNNSKSNNTSSSNISNSNVNCSSNSKNPIFTNFVPKIVICENKKSSTTMSDRDFESTVMHELVHAYDFCRAKVDIDNCEQYACLEVRASGLSGECNYPSEAARGNLGLAGTHSACTKRRAMLSVSMNSKCSAKAGTYIDAVFDRCYSDISPYLDDNDTP
jgi:hypothetical protein